MPQYAITRAVGALRGNCEVTYQPQVPIDLDIARRQHAQYEGCLERLGCELIRLSEQPDLPDAVFVEDTLSVERFGLFQPNIAISEQQDTQRQVNAAQGQLDEEDTAETDQVEAPIEA